LKDILQPLQGPPRAPTIDVALLAQITAAASASAPLSPTGSNAIDPANAQALHKVALKVADDHPDFLEQPGWEAVSNYVGQFA
jgi:hypothetical protein